MANQWFRMYSDFLEDAKIISLAFEDQRHFIGVLALKGAGLLDQECAPEVMDRLVGQKLWVDRSSIIEVKRRLVEVDLIDANWQPVAWDKRQFVSDRDPTAADRQQRKRDRDRKGEEKRNGSITRDSNDIVTRDVTDQSRRSETETETEEEANASLSEPASPVADRVDACPHQKIIGVYHEVLPELPGVVISRWAASQGADHLRTRWREDRRHQSLDFWQGFFGTVRTSKHWMGENERGWKADLRWLLERRNFDKVITQMVYLRQQEQAHG